mgnify:CR=1 FL=1
MRPTVVLVAAYYLLPLERLSSLPIALTLAAGLLALGAVNVAAGLVQGMPVSSSGSRTSLGAAAGSRSQVYSLVAAATVVIVPMRSFFSNPFEYRSTTS